MEEGNPISADDVLPAQDPSTEPPAAEQEPTPEPVLADQDPKLKWIYRIDFEPGGLSFTVDNQADSTAPSAVDAETGDVVNYYFAIVTEKVDKGDLKLAKLVKDLGSCGMATHTFDASSGAEVRITRVGVTDERLERFANAIDYERGLDPARIERACLTKGLVLENPEGKRYYKPYDRLGAPFESGFDIPFGDDETVKSESLYAPLTEGERMKLCRLLMTGNSSFEGDAKGGGLDINVLESSRKDNSFCKAVFPIHDPKLKDDLESKWMPISFPWKLPLHDIKRYFGEEVRSRLT